MGVSIYSYAGMVQFGLITDAALTPDPEAVVSRFSEEFEKYLYYALLDKPGVEKTAEPPPQARLGRHVKLALGKQERKARRRAAEGCYPSASSRACSASSFCIASAGLQRAASS
jgi:hypothetical protein